MLVFQEAYKKRGGALPLTYYLQPTVESRPGVTPTDLPPTSLETVLDGKTFFECVLHDEDFPTVAAFLLGGIPVDSTRPLDGATALHLAAALSHNHVSSWCPREGTPVSPDIIVNPAPNQIILSFLMDNGANVDSRAAGGETPLMVAVAAQNTPAIRLLLAKGADATLMDNRGCTCLSYAVTHPHVMLVLERWFGAEWLRQLAQRSRQLHYVCQFPGSKFAALFLIEQVGLDVNGRDATHSAAQGEASSGSKDSVAVTIGGGDGPVGGESPLHVAVRSGDVQLVKALVSSGADLHAEDERGVNPVRLAVSLPSRNRGTTSMRQYFASFCERPALVNTRSVSRFLTRYDRTNSASQRETLLTHQATHLLARGSHLFPALLAALLPHAAIVVYCSFVANLYGLLLVVVAILTCLAALQRMDAAQQGSRPLRSFGFFFGLVTAQSLCLPFYTTRYFYEYYSFENESHKALTFWLIPSAIAVVLSVLYVMIKSPLLVHSTAGQRKGIYGNIATTKGTPSRELIHSAELSCMVKKPLRAQMCPHLEAVVLRMDHYSSYLASTIAAHNHRAYVFVHIAFLSVLSSFYFYASAYYTIINEMQNTLYVAFPFTSRTSTAHTSSIHMSSTFWRVGFVYTQLLLPVMILLTAYQIVVQLMVVGRALTLFDLDHATTASSVYCFTLGNTVYSLFDEGYLLNWVNFFGRERLEAVVHRVPQMSARLKRIVQDYQRWQVNSSACGGGESGHHHHHHHGGALQEHGHAPSGGSWVPGKPSAGGGDDAPTAAPGRDSAVVPADVAAPDLAQHLFREMVRTKSTEVGGGSPEKPHEWDQAVAQARQMYQFFIQDMAASAASVALPA